MLMRNARNARNIMVKFTHEFSIGICLAFSLLLMLKKNPKRSQYLGSMSFCELPEQHKLCLKPKDQSHAPVVSFQRSARGKSVKML